MNIADMVEQMMDRGVDRDMILLAIRTAESTSRPVESPVDTAAARRRAYDRDRKQRERDEKRKSGGSPVENPQTSEPALTLTSSQQVEAVKEGKKVRARKSPTHPLPPDFQPKPSHFAAADRLKIPHSAVNEKAEDMRIWAASSGAVKADWDATLHGFLRRDADKLRNRKNGNVIDAQDRLNAKLAEFDRGDVQPSLRGGEGATDVRLLPTP